MSIRTRCALCVYLCASLLCGVYVFGCGAPPQIEITFRPMVGSKPFACGQTFSGLGKTKASFTPYDFRMMVHNVRLIAGDGTEVPVKLASDGKWQSSEVALLDFEDGTGDCETTGTKETRTTITGDAPAGEYKGIQFSLGVPFALNHANAFEASAPLNTTALFWSWALGYKFFRIDGKVPENENKFYRFHIGSMGCKVDSVDRTKVLECSLPNRAEIKLADFVPDKHAIVIDLAKILQDVTLDTKTDDRSVGCQSEPDNAQCAPVFQSMGLAYKSATLAPDQQSAFSTAPLR